MWLPPVIETARLVLRPVREADAGDMFEYCSDPQAMRFVAWRHRSLEDTRAFIAYGFETYRSEAPDPLCVTLKADPDRAIGHVGCFWVRKGHSMEIGWILAERFWRQGIATEAARTLIDHVFSNYPIERLQCTVTRDNNPSRRLAERLGMKFEGLLRSSGCWDGRTWDQAYYSVLRGEWSAKAGGPAPAENKSASPLQRGGGSVY